MNFVSIAFLVLYLFVLASRFCFASKSQKGIYLTTILISSVIFYAWHVPSYLILLSSIVVVHYYCAIGIDRFREDRGKAKIILSSAVGISLLILAYFKYGGFLLGLMNSLASGKQSTSLYHVILPAAISFYVFQSISYSVDVFRNQVAVEKRFLRLFLYIGFFPQLVAGPIVRASQFLYQFNRHRKPRLSVFLFGGYLIIRGFFLKMVVADNLGIVVDQYWPKLSDESTPFIVIASVAVFFSVQLLCDFMAYTDIARGIAYQLGFRLPINFKAPFIAVTFKEFWRRWHITLSTWFRDYVFIPLGGSRQHQLKALLALLVVFLLSGLWHGANLTFLAWGLINGVFLAAEVILFKLAERGFLSSKKHVATKPLVFLTRTFWFFTVQLGWIMSLVFFRSQDIAEANSILSNLVRFDNTSTMIDGKPFLITWFFCLPILLLHFRALATEFGVGTAPKPAERAIYAGVMLALTAMFYVSTRSFIYFQF